VVTSCMICQRDQLQQRDRTKTLFIFNHLVDKKIWQPAPKGGTKTHLRMKMY